MNLGIYIHIPFCQVKCIYCHFVSMPFSQAMAERYQQAVLKEINACRDFSAEDLKVDSIYFGGGTPSLIPCEQIEALLVACRNRFPISENCEISLEANPGTLTEDKVFSFFRSGVNRISLGAQSFNAMELSSIGRLHSPEMITKSISLLRAHGIANLNLDLMLGLPGQTGETWRRSLACIESLGVPHLSVYLLDLDDQCVLHEMVESGSVLLPEEDLISDLYLETIDFLSGRGYRQYEISNFALPGFSCRHNLKYWQRESFHGFGLGSHSFDGRSRYANFSQLDRYLDALESGKSPVEWREAMAAGQSLAESLFLGLRLTQGVDWIQLQAAYGRECLAKYEPSMRDLAEKGLIDWTGAMVRLTPSGMLLSNEVFQVFI